MIRAACLRQGKVLSRSARHGRPATSSASCICLNVTKDDDHEKNKNLSVHAVTALPFSFSRRGFASTTASSSPSDDVTQTDTATLSFDDTTPSFDDTMDKLLTDSAETIDPASVQSAADASVGAPVFDPTWYNIADQAIQAVNLVHETTGLNYALSIAGLTTAIRIFMFPLFVKAQQNTSRMAHMQPEMQLLKDKLEALGPNPDQETQVKYGLQMKALFKKYDCNPFRALALPIIQMPVFMGMFFGLRKMPTYFPAELATGGMLWFPDLCVPDPLYILPVGSVLSFLAMIQMGKDQMMASNPAQGQAMLNIFRGMSLIMFPVAVYLPNAILCYWVANNTFSLLQSAAFHNPAIRKSLGIWDPPKPVPGMPQPKSIVQSVQDFAAKRRGEAVTEQEKMQKHNEEIESKKMASAIAGRKRKRRRGSKNNTTN